MKKKDGLGRHVMVAGIKQELGTGLYDRERSPRKFICALNSRGSQGVVIPLLAFPYHLPQETSLRPPYLH